MVVSWGAGGERGVVGWKWSMKGLEGREVLLVQFELQNVKMICVHLIGLCVVV